MPSGETVSWNCVACGESIKNSETEHKWGHCEVKGQVRSVELTARRAQAALQSPGCS